MVHHHLLDVTQPVLCQADPTQRIMPNKALFFFSFFSPFVENVNILFVIHCPRLDLGIGTKWPSVVKSVCLFSTWIPSSHGHPVLNFFAGAAAEKQLWCVHLLLLCYSTQFQNKGRNMNILFPVSASSPWNVTEIGLELRFVLCIPDNNRNYCERLITIVHWSCISFHAEERKGDHLLRTNQQQRLLL